MKTAILAVLTALAIFAQVTVAPRFPISGAVFNFPLMLLVLIAAFGGPLAAMVTTPIVAILLGFASDRSPGLLLIGYLPLLPLGLLLEQSNLPLTHFFRTLGTGIIGGIWLRGILALAVMAQGAGFTVSVLTKVIIPGILLDFALLAVVYLLLRLIGLSGRSLTLSRGGFLAHE
jgi:hypothetical protein